MYENTQNAITLKIILSQNHVTTHTRPLLVYSIYTDRLVCLFGKRSGWQGRGEYEGHLQGEGDFVNQPRLFPAVAGPGPQ